MKLDITLDRWLPDLLPFTMPKGGLTICKNILPLEEYFAIMPQPIPYSNNAVLGTPLTAVEYFADDGKYYSFIGTTGKLYRLEPNRTLTDVTRVTGAYNTSTNRWYFAKYGNWIVATNFDDEIQVLKGMTNDRFEPLFTTETIKAKYLVQNHGHLMLGYYTKNNITYPNGVIWTGKDNIMDITASVSTGADAVNLEESTSPITGMVIFEFSSAGPESNIAIFHRNSISVAWYTGGGYTYNFDYNRYIEIGAIEGSPIIINGICYFYDEKTFYRWDGLNKPEDIGFGIRQTILNFLDISKYYKITTASHPRHALAIWSFVSTNNTNNGNPDYLLVLNTKNNKFALIEQAQYGIFTIHRNAWTIDMLGEFFSPIENIPYPPDNNFWSENAAIVGCLGTDLQVNVLQGKPMNWILETGETFTEKKEIIQSRRTRPIMQKRNSPVTVSLGSRIQESDAVSYVSANVAPNGYADIRAFGRYLRIKIEGGLHDGLYGIDLEGKVIGRK